VPTAIRVLDDPDARMVVTAGVVLKRVTGQDFGLKATQALPRFDPQGNLRRRFFGARTAAVFEAMVNEVTVSEPPRVSATD